MFGYQPVLFLCRYPTSVNTVVVISNSITIRPRHMLAREPKGHQTHWDRLSTSDTPPALVARVVSVRFRMIRVLTRCSGFPCLVGATVQTHDKDAPTCLVDHAFHAPQNAQECGRDTVCNLQAHHPKRGATGSLAMPVKMAHRTKTLCMQIYRLPKAT